jgi:hypothetical protein
MCGIPLRLQTIHGRAVDPERACHFRSGFSRRDAVDGLPTLVRRGLLRSPEAHAARLGTLAALAGARADQRALELSKPAQDGQHELAVRRGGVRPGVLERAEARAYLFDGFEDVEQITRGARAGGPGA